MYPNNVGFLAIQFQVYPIPTDTPKCFYFSNTVYMQLTPPVQSYLVQSRRSALIKVAV